MSVPLAVGTFLALLVVCPTTFWIASRLAIRASAPSVWLRRSRAGLWIVAGLSYLAFLVAGTDDLGRNAVTEVTPTSVSPIVGDAVAQLSITLPAALVTLATYAALVPAIRSVREIDLPLGRALLRLGRWAVAFATLFSVGVALVFWTLSTGGLTLALVLLLATILLLTLVQPHLLGVFRSIRTPNPDEYERLDRSCAAVGLGVEDVSILADADEWVEIHVRGFPGRRRLLVSEFLLEAFDDETIEALLAVEVGRLRTHHRGLASYAIICTLLVGVVVLAWTETTVVGATLLMLALVVTTRWLARRAMLHADEVATEVAGRDAVADALQRAADEQNLDVVRGRHRYVFGSRPTLGRRIDRLRET